MITDAQVHIYDPDTSQAPWPKEPGRTSPPAKHATHFSPEQMLGAMEAVGVDRAVIVPPAWAGENNAPALAAASKYPGRFAVMGRLDPYAADAQDRLERWLQQDNLLGIRMSGRWSTVDTQVQDAFQDPKLDWYWAACERLGIPLMLLTRQFASRLMPIAQRQPNLALIVDHLSAQEGETPAQAFAATDDLVELAKNARVYIKVGNGPNRSQQSFPFADVHPFLRRLYNAYGPRRLMWEADITQLTKDTYAECLRLWQEGIPFLTSGDKDWILGRTAAEVLNWPEK
jgi:predicted TIM-barrel fold metal-dependent hydrolase